MLGKLNTTTGKRMKWYHYFTPCTKLNSRWIEDSNVRPKTINLIEKNIGWKIFLLVEGYKIYIVFI